MSTVWQAPPMTLCARRLSSGRRHSRKHSACPAPRIHRRPDPETITANRSIRDLKIMWRFRARRNATRPVHTTLLFPGRCSVDGGIPNQPESLHQQGSEKTPFRCPYFYPYSKDRVFLLFRRPRFPISARQKTVRIPLRTPPTD